MGLFNIKGFLLVLLSLLLVSCGGGGSSISTTTLTGTAATGAPVVGVVSVIDATGAEVNVNTGTNGSFTLDTTGMTPPLMLKVVPGNGSAVLYSFASAVSQTVNITPLTNMALFSAAGNIDLAATYTAWKGKALTAANILNAQKVINANFTTQMTKAGIPPTTYDFFTTAFTANGAGIDGLMDKMKIIVNPTAGNVKITDLAGAVIAFNQAINVANINIPGAAAAGQVAAGANGGTLTISGDALLPATVQFTAAIYTANAFSTDVVWTLIDPVAGSALTVTAILAHPGFPATAFPSANLSYATGGIPPTTFHNWGIQTGQAAPGLVVDQQKRTAVFTNVQLTGSAPTTTTLTVNGTLTF